MLIPPLVAIHFLVNWLRQFGVKSRQQPKPDKFEFSITCLLDDVKLLYGRVTSQPETIAGSHRLKLHTPSPHL